ncbi:O-acetylhomoserine (thiol)-lyase [Termitomyces sp. J132]|nr:O-acetylhomoserine (thiol)-lyase [Termitomyces sp. J132]
MKAIFVEAIANPDYVLFDILALSKVAHDHKISLIVNNTFGMGVASNIYRNASVHSATKWIGGHEMIISGKTLSLHGERHSPNGFALAKWLDMHPHIAWVLYPGLESHPLHEMAKRQMQPSHFGRMLSFGIKGDIQTASQFVDNLKLVSNLPNVGDVKTLVIHPDSTSHSRLTAEEQLKSGVTPDLICVCLPKLIEAINNIIADFQGTFNVVFDA